MMEENELPDGWMWTTLGTISQWNGGGTPSKTRAEFWDGGNIPWVSPKDMKTFFITDTEDHLSAIALEEKTLKLCPPGTVLVVVRSGILERTLPVAISKTHVTMNQDMKGIYPKSGIDTTYLAYYLIASEYDILSRCSKNGTTVASIETESLRTYFIPLAPIPEQKRIVAAIEQQFTRLDAGIVALKSAQTRLKRYRATVLKAAVEGKLTEAWRAEHPIGEPASQLLARILQERRAKWEADLRAKGKDPAKVKYVEPAAPDVSGLGELPEGWCWTSFGQCIEVHIGATPSRKERSYWKGNIPWISSGEVQFCRIRETREYITQAGLSNSSTQINPAGSVLLGMIGEGRTRGQVAILDIDACNNQNCAALWVSQARIIPEYIYYWLWSQYEVTRQGSSGNNQPALNKVRVEQMLFPLLPISEQQQIVSEVERRLSVVSKLEAMVEADLKRAERLRQSVLKEAFAGRLVPQDPDDEPASRLLERIRQEREAAGHENKARKQSKQQHTYGKMQELREHETFQEAYAGNRIAQEPELIDESELEQVALWNAD